MFEKLFGSIRDNFRQKTTNPFLGTYTMVWIVRHWELVFGMFNFSEDWKLYQKINFIQTELNKFDIITDAGWNVLISLGVLSATYILLNLSRLIINFFEKVVTPYIYKWTDSKSIVLKSTFEKVRNERDDFRKRFDEERDTRSGFEDTIKELRENRQILNKDILKLEENSQIFDNREKKYQEEYTELENEMGKLVKERDSEKQKTKLLNDELSTYENNRKAFVAGQFKFKKQIISQKEEIDKLKDNIHNIMKSK